MKKKSVLWNGRVDLIGPRQDAAFQVENLSEARFSQEVHGFGGPLSAAAMRHDFPRRIQFMDASRQLPKRKQMPLQIADLVFMGLAHIENQQIISSIEAGFEFARSDFRYLHGRARSFFATHTAELVIVNQLGDRTMRPAHRAIRVLTELELA